MTTTRGDTVESTVTTRRGIGGGGAARRGRPGSRRVAVRLRDAGRRNVYFSAAAIPGHLAMAGWKGGLMLIAPSLFILGNVVFTLGLVGVKTLIVASDRRDRRGSATAAKRAYRCGGALLVVLAAIYIACCIPYPGGSKATDEYDPVVAIAIAAVTFVELGFSVHGLVSSRKRKDLLMELNKLGNLAASLILLVLTQTALLSMASEADHTFSNALCGLAMGSAVALIGVYMLVHRLPGPATDPTPRPLP
ncbi:hypothetical protein [Microbacterium sp. 18062]|uniref:hypothetical protein n=1 Tax=Microbacterium sp. 18062 TaxID=2681410 RepID=UPI00135CE26F|nr:hypothetical protein [Microbacterium sp. 18062]